ncbi:RES family NAD+ phosphorylase [Streptomyces sp. NPDC001663]|uniref:RES family NAD+ phosphorylase n=1 Tax=Streptomyces sp. NPDC001663 TaxID=3364597 RepID=UPI0036B2DCB0
MAEVPLAPVSTPSDGLWRVGRKTNPLRPSRLDPSGDIQFDGNGRIREPGRYDGRQHGTLYFSSDLEGCFAETLATFRVSAALKEDALSDEREQKNLKRAGVIGTTWREGRSIVHVHPKRQEGFLDIADAATLAALSDILRPELADLGIPYLDLGRVMSPNRKVTHAIAKWAAGAVDADGNPLYTGIRYISRHGKNWACWALFHRTEFEESVDEIVQEIDDRKDVPRDCPELLRIADLFGLTIE